MIHNNHPLSHITQSIKQITVKNGVCVGLSGGVDSIVLLHCLHQLIPSPWLTAIHIHHGLSPNADQWAEFCRQICKTLEIPLTVQRVSLERKGGESLENLARTARHEQLFKADTAVIAMAHHQDDQVETILSQIFRGSDLHNIGAMQEISKKHGKTLWRPLLTVSRQQIEEYARMSHLKYIVDESNFDTRYLRNFVRHDVINLLKKWDSNILPKILNLNEQLQELLAIMDQVGEEDLNKCKTDQLNINIDLFKEFSPQRQTNILSRFILLNHLPLPSHKQLNEFNRQVLWSKWDKKPQLKLSNDASLLKYKNTISLILNQSEKLNATYN